MVTHPSPKARLQDTTIWRKSFRTCPAGATNPGDCKRIKMQLWRTETKGGWNWEILGNWNCKQSARLYNMCLQYEYTNDLMHETLKSDRAPQKRKWHMGPPKATTDNSNRWDVNDFDHTHTFYAYNYNSYNWWLLYIAFVDINICRQNIPLRMIQKTPQLKISNCADSPFLCLMC